MTAPTSPLPPAKFDFHAVQQKWAKKWQEKNTYKFRPTAKGEIYSIDSPPPFTSGALHMGHVLSYAFFDFAARYKRMRGYNVFYPQGWDCQGFPTEVKVEKLYGKSAGGKEAGAGVKKLSRAEFKKKCVEFTLENIAKMRQQMETLGFSPDWSLEYRTVDPSYHRAVQLSILQMHRQGLVYRARHPVLFCVNCQSAIAKAETEDSQRASNLNYIYFTEQKTGRQIQIATTRPELLHACVAVLVKPTDKRYAGLIGSTLLTPIYNKPVQVKADADVDSSFGTGVVMVCTFGDKTDVAWIYRHSLPTIESMDNFGKICNSNSSYNGLSIAKAREKIIEDLRSAGLLAKQEPVQQNVKTHDRCGKVVEFYPSFQWFMKLVGWKEKIKKAAGKMEWFPEFSRRYLEDWADFVEFDWVISRQRIYGTPLPFYYCQNCGEVYPARESELPVDPALREVKKKCKCGSQLSGETSVCDCWVDSSITPLVIAGWPDDKELMKKVFPSTLRPQGLEIIRTWAFYTIYRCLALTGKVPFKQVLINGSVLGTDGKKMSKSVGNFEDPAVLLARFPADALRQWAALSGALARDRAFSYKDIEHSQAFLNKLSNAAKFVALAGKPKPSFEASKAEFNVIDRWLLSELHGVIEKVTAAMDNYDYYAAINAIHNFFWHSFCDYYLEDVKHRIYENGKGADAARYVLNEALLCSLKLLAPLAPFTCEELYHELGFAREEGSESIHLSKWPLHVKELRDGRSEQLASILHAGVAASRKFRGANSLPFSTEITAAKVVLPEQFLADFSAIWEDFCSIARIKSLEVTTISSSEPSFEFIK